VRVDLLCTPLDTAGGGAAGAPGTGSVLQPAEGVALDGRGISRARSAAVPTGSGAALEGAAGVWRWTRRRGVRVWATGAVGSGEWGNGARRLLAALGRLPLFVFNGGRLQASDPKSFSVKRAWRCCP
jgi:hypothetical protein